MRQFLRTYWLRLPMALLVAVYLKFLLVPTAVVFYELHHLTGLDAIYWGYSIFKVMGYYFGNWGFQTVACVGVAILIAIPWRGIYRLIKPGTVN